jgi:exosortase D (VPLPA-CTERM-specific)
MSATFPLKSDLRWTIAPASWLMFSAVLVLMGVAFFNELAKMVAAWETMEEYSFGYFVPLVTIYLLWQKRGELAATPFQGSWWGSGVLLVALGLGAIGRIASTEIIVQYAFCLALMGLVIAYAGWRGFKIMAMPLLILMFMVPAPRYLMIDLSQAMQLWSSKLGVGVIRQFGISVYLEGNVIDLGAMKLQVVDACSGLRYLFPLATIGVIAAYLFRVALWKRVLIFLSTLPIALLMNSLRIGVIGVTVEYFGKSMAEGVLHDFEGWVVFMLCTAILIAEMAVLARVGAGRTTLAKVFVVDAAPVDPNLPVAERSVAVAFYVAVALIALAAFTSLAMPQRAHEAPARLMFDRFPMQFEDWTGRTDRLDREVVDALQFDDYIIADYVDQPNALPINFYSAYYADQGRNGVKPHSPRGCIPAGGWEIKDASVRTLDSVPFAGRPLHVNRFVIEKGDSRQLVYYWFQERGRNTVDEHFIKLEIFWDAVTRNRTDGALVRLIARLAPGESIEFADQRLERFARLAVPALTPFIPE